MSKHRFPPSTVSPNPIQEWGINWASQVRALDGAWAGRTLRTAPSLIQPRRTVSALRRAEGAVHCFFIRRRIMLAHQSVGRKSIGMPSWSRHCLPAPEATKLYINPCLSHFGNSTKSEDFWGLR